MPKPADQTTSNSLSELSAEDVALVVLAVIAEQMGAPQTFGEPELHRHWRNTGLRKDDLVQGLVTLARDGRVRIATETPDGTLTLSTEAHNRLSNGRHTFRQLPAHIRSILDAAANRTDDDAPASAQGPERRDGFC